MGEGVSMRKISTILFAVLFAAPFALTGSGLRVNASVQETKQKRTLHVPYRRRRSGSDVSGHKGIGHAYKSGGKSAGRGGRRLGRNVAHGKPVKGGKEFGKGMGGFGKGVGKGTGRSGKKVGNKIKNAVKP